MLLSSVGEHVSPALSAVGLGAFVKNDPPFFGQLATGRRKGARGRTIPAPEDDFLGIDSGGHPDSLSSLVAYYRSIASLRPRGLPSISASHQAFLAL